ncbi:MAG: adenylate/guanylate cyclase domain-containing protein [Betaproteobacteria bacterium]|nr:MAG: adenylate/guanylate cyclase domain-containing protein [Betaproteobacteria bacterium]
MANAPSLSFRLRGFWRFVLVVAVAFGLSEAMLRLGWLEPLENVYYDYAHQYAGKRRDASHVAVVAVDEQTLDQYKDDPLAFWQPHFARAMETLTLAGVKVIGLDYLYQVSAEDWLKKLNLPGSDSSRSYDSPFRAQLAAGNKILITQLVELSSGEGRLLLPPRDHLYLLPQGVNDLGIANLNPDDDNSVRRFLPVFDPDPEKPAMGFATQLALRAAGLDPNLPEWEVAGVKLKRDAKPRLIGYVGPPGTILTVSMSKLLKPDALADPEVQLLKGRAVIIAANDRGTQDRHPSPYSRAIFSKQSDQMIGGEIHANIIETILSGHYPRHLATAVELIYVLALVAIAALLYLRLHPLGGLAVALALSVLCLVPAWFMFLDDWLLPVGRMQIALGLGFLTTLGLRLTGEERERARLKKMFGRYVSDDVVKLLTEGERPDLAGESVQVTVLFSDIRNFTTISEKLNAHEVVEMLNAYFSRTTEPILVEGGMVNKFIGDAVMAIFGSPVRHRDHARRALRAALQMAREAEDFKQWMRERFPDRGLPEFGIGIGVHSGEAVIGDIGSVKRTEFTAIGDTVNAASRLEGVTKEMHCVLVASKACVDAAGAGVITGKQETLKVKGKEHAIEVFEIMGLEPAADVQ